MNHQRTIDFRYAPPLSWTAICRPDDPDKTLVSERGALLYGFESHSFESWHFRRVFEFGLHTAQGVQSIRQTTESARIPVVITTLEYSHATLTLRTFGHLDEAGRRSDVVLWEVAVHPDQDEFLVHFTVDAYEQGTIFTGRSVAPANAIFAVPSHRDIVRPSRWEIQSRVWVEDPRLPAPGAIAYVSSPHPLTLTHADGFRPCSPLGIAPTIVRGGERMGGALIFPLNHGIYHHLDEAWALAALEKERAFWTSYLLPARTIQVPDSGVMEMITACARNILQAREIKDGAPVFQVGATVYRSLFVVDGHFFLDAAQYLGYAEEAFAGLTTLLRRVKPNGAIMQMEHHSKETGISLATLVRQCELMNRDDFLDEVWPTIQRAVSHIGSLVAEGQQLPVDAPNHGLMPDSFADGGIGGQRAEYTTTFWTMVGLKQIAQTAARLDKPEDAAQAQQLFDSLMHNLRRAIARDTCLTADGATHFPIWMSGSGAHHWIPNYPDTPAPHHHLQPQSGVWALNQTIYPGEIFAPDDPIVRNLCELYEWIDDAEGVPASTGWLPYRALWTYEAAFAAQVWLYAGRPDKAVDYLYAFANHASPTRVWREEQSLRASDNGQLFGDMPHNWASAEFIRLVRHLLVFERGETLELLPGLPPEWRVAGSVTELDRTPTRFGAVSLKLHVGDEGAFELTLHTQQDWHRHPTACRLFLTPGSVARCGEVELVVAANGVVELPWNDSTTLQGRFA
ncbi:MAG: hypothetical protein U0350_26165 [Caldilineaceae bacterium]